MKIIKRRTILFLGYFLCFSLSLASCGDSNDELQEFLAPASGSEIIFEQGFSFGEAASSQSASFEAGQQWTATINGVDNGWCSITPKEGKAGKGTVMVSVGKNETGNPRTAQLNIISGSKSKQITVTQSANAIAVPDGLSYSPEKPDADHPLTITFKADTKSALYGYTGDVYMHIGIVSEGTWLFVPAEWSENKDKCKMAFTESNVWSITLSPNVREWFGSGTTPVNQLGIVVRSKDGSRKGVEMDSFVEVSDSKYEGFIPGEVKTASLPSGVEEGINVVNNSTVTLVLYDKDKDGGHKDFAYVVGDFNNWTLGNDEKAQMYRDNISGCWWITLNGLDASREYAFQYYVGTRGGKTIRLADAYTEKILDPDNDSYIPVSTYSESKTYPEGGKGIVSTFKIQKDNYNWKVSNFKIDRPEQLVIYELHLRDFTSSGDLNGARAKLSYLKEMGVNAIELMPVQEFDGNDSWGYNPCFFFAMDKAYGTKIMYKQFIDACHEAGMAVILDVVYNHATGNHPFAKLYWDSEKNLTASNNPYFNATAPHPYSVFHDFNHESELVRRFVKRNLRFLLSEYRLDGFRFDLTKGFTQKNSTESTASNYDESRVAILKDYYAAIKQAKSDAYVILEHFCDSKEEKELATEGMHLWRNLNNAYCQAAMGYSSESSFGGLYEKTPAWVGFMESHDEERMGYKQTQWGDGVLKTSLASRIDQLELNTTFFLTVPGPKMIWQFGEMGYDVSIEYNGRTGKKPLHWEYLDNADRKGLHAVYVSLMKLRNAHPELFDGSAIFEWKVSVSDWADGRSLSVESITGKKLVVVGNFTQTTTDVTFPATVGNWTNYFSGKNETVGVKVNVPAHGYKVYTNF
ncbi:alpha-amylase family glycosyl hydrolase [Bacteroides helcogenes]|uniref:Alpha amylase catalytic region n=1 Tax=Bacteroides helcogenes (strain ATCC 35417 / DSM 20613 / JCM 6297 / CCUG 15421 / P 36-108) TaxID=693979 RepID=E6SQE8_BACT6|nr:alpha-amylase family glycosyl hydrolase [Bacteroides helcogenes]ADV44995.1 alpha amylase catalytic region [Bacteroides helcogenes P 36-108]MDY5239854.1 alpha-amylase family glycosyl hydrolase [Bacteroides helcogenes]